MNFFSKLFGGNKSDKDVKKMSPIIGEINEHYQNLQSLSNDELRHKTQEFKVRIAEYLKPINAQIAELKTSAESQDQISIYERESIFQEVDKLIKQRDEQIEEILAE